VLVAGVFAGGAANTAALVGAIAAYLYFVTVRIPVVPPVKAQPVEEEDRVDTDAIRNAARFVAVKKALAARSATEIDRLSAQFERDIVRGVNICPPVDYKPEGQDGYCIRCDGFSECAVRYLLVNRPAAEPKGSPAEAGATSS